uniref:Uncharacterized protein n=1 Tax=Arundo donax TaxID=35708 RepID=A0A0A9CRT4_ARUDO
MGASKLTSELLALHSIVYTILPASTTQELALTISIQRSCSTAQITLWNSMHFCEFIVKFTSKCVALLESSATSLAVSLWLHLAVT